MSTAEDLTELHRLLRSRRDQAARNWQASIVHTSFTSLSTTEELGQFERLTDKVIELLACEPFEPGRARAVGVSLARMHYLSSEAIGQTQKVLGQQLLAELPEAYLEQASLRVLEVLPEVAAGFFQQAREMILGEQERVKVALLEERNRSEEALRRSEATLAEAQRIAHVGHWEYDPQEGKLRWSDEIYRIFGLPPGRSWETVDAYLDRLHPDDAPKVAKVSWEAVRKSDQVSYEHRIVRPDGEIRYVRQHMELALDRGKLTSSTAEHSVLEGFADEASSGELAAPVDRRAGFERLLRVMEQLVELTGSPVRLLGTVQDITERKALEMKLEHQALHDSLTGLPNRDLFKDRLEQALARSGRGDERVYVFFLDLDAFKLINDSLGHAAGDQLLIEVAKRLRSSLRSQDTVARFGGDEFMVLIEESAEPAAGIEEARAVARRILRTLEPPMYVLGHEVVATASLGISSSAAAREPDPESLIRDADAAMYRAKAAGRSRYEVFEPDMNARALEYLKLEGDLRRALEQGQFVVHYQPEVELASGRVAAMEALVRLQHPERGLLLPQEFLQTAESSGLIRDLDHRVIEEACYQASAWQRRNRSEPPLGVSVNLSASQLQYPGLDEELLELLESTGVSPETVELEITEDVAMKDMVATASKLRELKALGLRLAIDDFGTGHSSLSYLKHLPVDTIKLDKAFINGLGRSHSDTLIVSATISLGQALGLKVVAEGVETEEQRVKLKELGCDLAQGYFFARPKRLEQALASLDVSL